MKALWKLFAASILVAATVSAWAWHEGKPKGAEFAPEEGDSVRSGQQADQRVSGEVGVVQSDDDEPQAPSGDPSDEDAAAAVSSSEKDAEENLKGAEASIKGSKSRSGSFLFTALICAALGFGGIAAVRHWANKAIPVPTSKTRRHRP